MWGSIVVLFYLAFVGFGRRVQNLAESIHHSQSPNRLEIDSAVSSTDLQDGTQSSGSLLLAYAPAAKFHRSTPQLPRNSQSQNLEEAHSIAHSSDLLDRTQSISSSLSSTQLSASAGMPFQSSRDNMASSQLHLPPTRPRGTAVEMLTPPTASLAIFGIGNFAGFLISAVTGWHYHLDLIGTGVFAVFAYCLRGTTLVQTYSARAIGLWATRLASFLFLRVVITKRDARLSTTLSRTSGQFGFWLISFLWGWLVSMPHTLAANVPSSQQPEFGNVQIAGLVMFALGFLIETGADFAKIFFKAQKANKGKFCDLGVWRLCQHPNWFGNLLLWCGIFVMNAPTLLSYGQAEAAVTITFPVWAKIGEVTFPLWVNGVCRLLGAAISPLFLFWLFSGQANGTPPLHKGFELMQARFANDEAFQKYDACTPRLIPSFKSIISCICGKRFNTY